MRTPTPLLIFTFALTTTLLPTITAQIVQQVSDGQLQVPTALAPLTTAPAPKLAVPTNSPPLPAPIESATTIALPPSSTAAIPPPPTLAIETTAPASPPPPPPNEAAETLPSPPPVTANISVTYTSTSLCTGTGTGPSVAGNTTVPTVPSVPSVVVPASTEGGPGEAGTTAPTANNVGTRLGWGGVGGVVVGVSVVFLWSL